MPDSFSIIRCLLDRIEDSSTGKVVEEFQVKIPEHRIIQLEAMTEVLCDSYLTKYQLAGPVAPLENEREKLRKARQIIIDNTWKTTVAIVGANGIPTLNEAGNTTKTEATIRVSMRLPPTLDADEARKKMEKLLMKEPFQNAQVSLKFNVAATGMACPELSQNLARILNNASLNFFGKEMLYLATGGTIPIAMVFGKKVSLEYNNLMVVSKSPTFNGRNSGTRK